MFLHFSKQSSLSKIRHAHMSRQRGEEPIGKKVVMGADSLLDSWTPSTHTASAASHEENASASASQRSKGLAWCRTPKDGGAETSSME